mgnify:CR=1 FL=1
MRRTIAFYRRSLETVFPVWGDGLLFLSFFVQRLRNLLRDALPFLLTLCPRISFQRGIPQIRCLTGPYFKLALGHQSASDTGKIFFVRPLVNLPDIIVFHLASEAAARADLTAGLAVLSRCSSGAIGVGRPGFLNQRPQLAQRFGTNPFCSPFMNST